MQLELRYLLPPNVGDSLETGDVFVEVRKRERLLASQLKKPVDIKKCFC